MKKLFFLGACLVALASSPVQAQVGSAEVVVVHLYNLGGAKTFIAISRGAGPAQVTERKADNAELTTLSQEIIAGLYKEGYTLKNVFNYGAAGPYLVFTKEK